MDPNGNPSNEDSTLVDHGFAGCPDATRQPDPPPSAYTNGVVTPHAAFLALRYAPRETLDNVAKLAPTSPACTTSGASATASTSRPGMVSGSYLSLDQGMIMASLGNALGDDVLRRAFADRDRARAAPGDRRRAVRRSRVAGDLLGDPDRSPRAGAVRPGAGG